MRFREPKKKFSQTVTLSNLSSRNYSEFFIFKILIAVRNGVHARSNFPKNIIQLPLINEHFLSFLQASGVTVADICKTTYEEIKKDKKHRYVIFYIKDEKQIDVEVIGPRDATYDQFLEDLQKGGSGECRYGLFDFEYTHQCQGTSEVRLDDDEQSSYFRARASRLCCCCFAFFSRASRKESLWRTIHNCFVAMCNMFVWLCVFTAIGALMRSLGGIWYFAAGLSGWCFEMCFMTR